MRSVPIPTLIAVWNPSPPFVLLSAAFDVPMDTTVAPNGDAFAWWIDGVPTFRPPFLTNWINPQLLDLGLFGGPLRPAAVSWSLLDYDPDFRWKPAKLVDPFAMTTVPVI